MNYKWRRINPIPVDIPKVMVVFCGQRGVELRKVPVTELSLKERFVIQNFDSATEPETKALLH